MFSPYPLSWCEPRYHICLLGAVHMLKSNSGNPLNASFKLSQLFFYFDPSIIGIPYHWKSFIILCLSHRPASIFLSGKENLSRMLWFTSSWCPSFRVMPGALMVFWHSSIALVATVYSRSHLSNSWGIIISKVVKWVRLFPLLLWFSYQTICCELCAWKRITWTICKVHEHWLFDLTVMGCSKLKIHLMANHGQLKSRSLNTENQTKHQAYRTASHPIRGPLRQST